MTRFYGHDMDWNGTLNIHDDNDDWGVGNDTDARDPWPTRWEVEWGLDPYYNDYKDTARDLDGDGRSNRYEWDNQDHVNLTVADSDGDGLEDGEELDYWLSRSVGEQTALQYAATYDVDGDGIGDGQELDGYEVTVVWTEGEETKSLTKTIYGDPLGKYRGPPLNPTDTTATGPLLDVDGDGISDHDEVDPRRSGAAQAVKDFVALYGDNETLMNNTFQQFVRDEMPPVIRGFDVYTDWEEGCLPPFGWPCIPIAAWAVVTVQAIDPSPYTITVTVVDNGRSESFQVSGNATVTSAIPIDILSDALLDYHVRVTATDAAGNTASATEKVTGILGAIVAFFASVLAAVWGAIVAAAEAVAAAVAFLIDIAVAIVKAALDILLSPVIDAIVHFVSAVHEWINAAMFEYEETGTVSRATARQFQSILDGPFVTVVTALTVGLAAVATVAMILTGGLALVTTFIIDMIISLILSALVQVLTPVISSLGVLTYLESGDVMGFLTDGLSAFLEPVSDKVESRSWTGAIGLGLALIVGALSSILSSYGIYVMVGLWLGPKIPPPAGWKDLLGDIVGLIMAFIGMVLAFSSDLWVNMLGLAIAGFGLFLTFWGKHPIVIVEKWATPIALGGLIASLIQTLDAAFDLP